MRRTLFAIASLFAAILMLFGWSRSEASDAIVSQKERVHIDDTQTPSFQRFGSASTTMQQWGLTPQEYARYRSLMAGVRGAFSKPNISPLEVLGIHARTPEERRRYAERLVHLLYEDTERVLAFEREVQAAWKRLGVSMFEPYTETGALIPGPGLGKALAGNRLAVFVATKGCPKCRDQVRLLVARADDLPGLDIYVTDTGDADAIRAFARSADVPPEAVASRKITLNRGAGLFALYEGDKSRLPALFVRLGDRLVPLDQQEGVQR